MSKATEVGRELAENTAEGTEETGEQTKDGDAVAKTEIVTACFALLGAFPASALVAKLGPAYSFVQ